MKTQEYITQTRGHVWKTDEDGSVDIFAYYSGEYHNGPECVVCGYGFCHHCHDIPQIDCTATIVEAEKAKEPK